MSTALQIRRGLALALLAVAARPAGAWAPETRVRMIDEAIRLMPASLRLALEHHREMVLRGMLEPMTTEEGAEHLPPWQAGSVERSVDRAASTVVAAAREPAPFAEVSRAFGLLAHFVADAGFPPGAGGPDAAGRYHHFATFCETRRPKFPVVFYGHGDADLDRGDFARFALRILERARAEDGNLARAYAAAGDPPDPAAFDDRSVPFAVGSLAYSRTITEIVRAWLAAWKAAGGDLGRTPYLVPAARPPEGSRGSAP